MTPTVLITGRDGQLGFELQRTLSPVSNVIAVGTDIVDLRDLNAVRKLVRDTRPTVIVNAAAYTAVDRAESERDIAQTVNGEVPGVLAEELTRVGGKLIVHYSTDYVFDGTATQPYTEDRDPSPISVYGQTKLAGERAVEQAGAPYAVLRTEWLYATRGANFLLTILRLAREGKPLRIVADQVGAPTWARMLAESSAIIVAFFLRASASEGNTLSGTYHITAAGQTTWHDFAQAILEEALARLQRLGKPLDWCETALASLQPIPASEYPLPARRPGYSVLSNEKVERVFGIHLPDWRDQLHMAFEAFDCPG
jgi:dTDP-4-dehydrorhamnose reductase